MPALRRYLSPRIHLVRLKSKSRDAGFAILSGRFGLIGPYRKIPFYDHLLRRDEIARLLPQMVDYLIKKRYRSVYFFHEPLRRSRKIGPYCDAIRRACRLAQARLKMIEIR